MSNQHAKRIVKSFNRIAAEDPLQAAYALSRMLTERLRRVLADDTNQSPGLVEMRKALTDRDEEAFEKLCREYVEGSLASLASAV